jgi:hypothetical protein
MHVEPEKADHPMVMTKALAETGSAREAAIIDYLPTYWSMVPNIEEIASIAIASPASSCDSRLARNNSHLSSTHHYQ